MALAAANTLSFFILDRHLFFLTKTLSYQLSSLVFHFFLKSEEVLRRLKKFLHLKKNVFSCKESSLTQDTKSLGTRYSRFFLFIGMARIYRGSRTPRLHNKSFSVRVKTALPRILKWTVTPISWCTNRAKTHKDKFIIEVDTRIALTHISQIFT